MRIAWYKSVVLPANWKTALDAFIESWHVPGTHPQLLRPDKRSTPPTIAECEAYGATFNELFRLHSRHADLFRYGPEGDATKLRGSYRTDPAAVRRNVEYSLRELRALYLRTDLDAAERADDHRGGGRSGRQRHLPAVAAEARPGGGYRLPRALRRAAEGGHVRLAPLPEHGVPRRHGLLPRLPGPPRRHRPRPLRLRRPGSRAAAGRRAARRPLRSASPTGARPTWARSSGRTSRTCPR